MLFAVTVTLTALHWLLIVLGVVLLLACSLAAIYAAKHRRERDHRISNLREQLEDDEHYWLEIGLPELAGAIRHGLSGSFAKAWRSIEAMRTIFRDPKRRAAAEQHVLERLVKRTFESRDADRMLFLKRLVAQESAKEEVAAQADAAGKAAANAVQVAAASPGSAPAAVPTGGSAPSVPAPSAASVAAPPPVAAA